jgi:hypothetical protein
VTSNASHISRIVMVFSVIALPLKQVSGGKLCILPLRYNRFRG